MKGVRTVVWSLLACAVTAHAASGGGLPPEAGSCKPVPAAYVREARAAYRTAAYAAGTNSVIGKYSREDPFGPDARLDEPGGGARPDQPIVWRVNGLRNVRDIGGWTGLRTGRIYRGSELSRVPGFSDGIDPETRRIVRDVWNLATDFDLRGNSAWGIRDYGNTNLVELQSFGVPKLSFAFPSYLGLFKYPQIVSAALKALAKPETYPTYIHCAGGADRTGSLIFILEALCGVPEADIDVDYELTSFAQVFGLRNRFRHLTLDFLAFKDAFRAYRGATLQEQVATACREAFGLTQAEIDSIRRLLKEEDHHIQP